MMKKVLILTVGGSHESIVKSIKDNKSEFLSYQERMNLTSFCNILTKSLLKP